LRLREYHEAAAGEQPALHLRAFEFIQLAAMSRRGLFDHGFDLR
jgi:hypothetical protein